MTFQHTQTVTTLDIPKAILKKNMWWYFCALKKVKGNPSFSGRKIFYLKKQKGDPFVWFIPLQIPPFNFFSGYAVARGIFPFCFSVPIIVAIHQNKPYIEVTGAWDNQAVTVLKTGNAPFVSIQCAHKLTGTGTPNLNSFPLSPSNFLSANLNCPVTASRYNVALIKVHDIHSSPVSN